jgi:hypothetical protein
MHISQVALDGLAQRSSYCFVADIDELLKDHFRPGETALRDRYPEAEFYVRCWLPGYSKDGKTALVRMTFAPTPHGASATFLLERNESGWHVVNRNFSYYT